MKTKTHIILYIVALPWNLTVAWPAILLFRLFWGENLHWETPPSPRAGGPVLVCELRKDSWPVRTWYAKWGATTLGHGIFYSHDQLRSGTWLPIQTHEHVHVEQFESYMVAAFLTSVWVSIVYAALGHWLAALVVWLLVWWLGGVVTHAGAWFAAWCRGEDPYRGSAHEESAYSQAGEH